MSATSQEAYLVGCLMGRGIIEQNVNNYRLTFRIPFREYDPVGREIVSILVQNPSGLTHRQLLNLPVVRAKRTRNLGNKLGKLKRWNPPTRIVPGNMIEKVGRTWRIGDRGKASEYLQRQKTRLDREHSAIKEYVLQHLMQALSHVSNQVEYSEDPLSFGIMDHSISCEVDQPSFNNLRSRYNLTIGELHRTNPLPSVIYSSSRDVQEEFIRGLADVVGSFDKWLRKWRVQFSILDNEAFCIQLCGLFQVHLGIPVHYIEWNEEYMARGSRDILLKLWTPNAAMLTDRIVFHNRIKQTEFLQNLDSTIAIINAEGRPNMFNPCPRDPQNLKHYTERCLRCGCSQISTIP